MLWAAAAVFLAVIAICFAMGATAAEMAIHPHLKDSAFIVDQEKRNGYWDAYDAMEKQELDLASWDGYVLHGTYLPASQPSNKLVIITHGHTYNRLGGIKYAGILHEYGYDCYIYDLRHHGANKRCECSMGYLEAKDIASLYEWFRAKRGEKAIIGLLGESLGAASSMVSLKYCTPDFCIEDCGFADLLELMSYQIHHTAQFPSFILLFGYAYVKLRYGFRWKTSNAIDSVRFYEKPMLFIHGEADSYVLCQNAYDLYDAKTLGYRQIEIFPEAEHAQSLISDPKRYAEALKGFLQRIEK